MSRANLKIYILSNSEKLLKEIKKQAKNITREKTLFTRALVYVSGQKPII